MRVLMSPRRCSVPLCLGIVRSVFRDQLSRSSRVRAWRNSASAALYSGVRLAGISPTTVGPPKPVGAAMLGPGQPAAPTTS
jgi:hypothetical protein